MKRSSFDGLKHAESPAPCIKILKRIVTVTCVEASSV